MGTKSFLFVITLSFLASGVHAQDPWFTQTFQSPMYYNPAFAGFQQNFKGGVQFRVQPLLNSAYVTFAAFADAGFPKINSGTGLMLSSSNYGNFSSTAVNGFYAYQVKLADSAFLRVGINAGLFQRVYDYGIIDTLSAKNGPSAVQATPFIPNFGVGALYCNNNFYLGLAAYNITEPNQSIDGTPDSKLYRRYDLQLGGFFNASGIVINPNLLVVSQSSFLQVMPGISATLGIFTLGTALRFQANPNVQSLNLLFGFTGAKFKFCYSYDLSLANTGFAEGVHELSFFVQLNSPHETSDKPMIGYMRRAY